MTYHIPKKKKMKMKKKKKKFLGFSKTLQITNINFVVIVVPINH